MPIQACTTPPAAGFSRRKRRPRIPKINAACPTRNSQNRDCGKDAEIISHQRADVSIGDDDVQTPIGFGRRRGGGKNRRREQREQGRDFRHVFQNRPIGCAFDQHARFPFHAPFRDPLFELFELDRPVFLPVGTKNFIVRAHVILLHCRAPRRNPRRPRVWPLQ